MRCQRLLSVLGLIVALLWTPGAQSQYDSCVIVTDIIFVLDASGSIASADYEKQLSFAVNLTQSFTIGATGVRFGAVVFGDYVQKVFDLGTYSTQASLAQALRAAPYINGATNTDKALDLVYNQNLFGVAAGGRSGADKIVIVMTDGRSKSLTQSYAAAHRLREAGTTIISVGVGQASKLELLAIASGPDDVFQVADYEALAGVKEQVAKRACENSGLCSGPDAPQCEHGCVGDSLGAHCVCNPGYIVSPTDPTKCVDVDECISPFYPCEQLCSNTVGGYTCSCREGYTVSSSNPSKCSGDACAPTADIFFLVDSSGSITPTQFKQRLQFAVELTLATPVGPEDIQFGALVFSDNPQIIFDLNDYTDHDSLDQALLSASHRGGSTATHKALDYIRQNNMFGTEAGGRAGAAKIVVIFTDGGSDSVTMTLTAASKLKSSGVTIIAVGSPAAKDLEFLNLASSKEDAIKVEYGGPSAGVLARIGRVACPARLDRCLDVENPPCQQICTDNGDSVVCSCREGYKISATDPSKCEDVNECSASISPCEHLCSNSIGSYSCSCRIGYVVSASDPSKCEARPDSCLNTENPPCEQICTDNQGSPVCSCREGYRISAADPSKCEDIDECSSSIANCEQICTNLPGSYKCSCEEGFAVSPEDISTCVEVDICVTKADIFLVFDSSASIGIEHYHKQFEFAKRLVKHFIIADDYVLVGSLIFSREVSKLFDLKDGNNPAFFSTAFDNVPYMNSSTYTHQAFNFIYYNDLFNDTAGGRADATDIVILLTDGASNRYTSTLSAAQNLKDRGIAILAVGIGNNVYMPELYAVASSQEDVINAANYDKLDYIEQRVADRACSK